MREAAPVGPPDDAAWERLHEFELKFGNCWEHCGSYCCRTNHPAQSFALMKADSAGMVFMPGEYEFLARHGRLQQGFETTHRHFEFVFDEARGLRLGFDTAVCSLGGLCSLPRYRPMICKFYPYYPVVSPHSGQVEQFITGSIIDQYWTELGIEHPCWLHREHGAAVREAVRQTAPALDHPYFVFHLGAAFLFVEHVTARARGRHPDLFHGDPRQFFSQWEVLYLTGGFFDRETFSAELRDLHAMVERRYGSFVLQ